MLLAGKTAVISGAASPRGIGRATAQLFAGHGARVAILDIDAGAAEAAAVEIGRGAIGLRCDVAEKAACEAAVARVLGEFSRIDSLLNNAGITEPVKIMEVRADNWGRIIDVNLTGVLNLSQAVIPHMRAQKSGSIICMSSISAQRGGGIFGGPHYAAAKAGVLGLAKAMARELGPDNIRVNCIAPSLINTDIVGGKLSPERRARILEDIPLGRVGTALDVAGVYLFLASDLSSYVTGATIDVNGGMLIY